MALSLGILGGKISWTRVYGYQTRKNCEWEVKNEDSIELKLMQTLDEASVIMYSQGLKIEDCRGDNSSQSEGQLEDIAKENREKHPNYNFREL